MNTTANQTCGLIRRFCDVGVLAGILATLCSVILGLWCASDACFMNLLFYARETIKPFVGLHTNIEFQHNPLFRYHLLGSRMILLFVLFLVTVVSLLTALCAIIRGPTALRAAALGGSLVSWLAVACCLDAIDDRRLLKEVRDLVTDFRETALAVSEDWPLSSRRLPSGIRVMVSPDHTDRFSVKHKLQYPWRETYGFSVRRRDNGIIIFDLLGPWDSAVEYRPDGTEPKGWDNTPPIRRVIRIDTQWYLVRYGEPVTRRLIAF